MQKKIIELNHYQTATPPPAAHLDLEMIKKIISRAHYLATQMIVLANHRKEKEKGEPKVGGHASSCCSCVHIMGALHLLVKSGQDWVVNKPHASPTDHSYSYLLDLLLHEDLSPLSLTEANKCMNGLRAFASESHKVFQSYHSALDPDHHNFLPSGTVGIPAVNAAFLALAYRLASHQGYAVPEAHFWCLIGDSEFREGSLTEAMPEIAERKLGNVTWIIDYNRQSLDGHRITEDRRDDHRIAKMMEANGWHVIQLEHGRIRKRFFSQPGGKSFQHWIEHLSDYEMQSFFLVKDPDELKTRILASSPRLEDELRNVDANSLHAAFNDLGGHDVEELYITLEQCKNQRPNQPKIVIAHTIKGWGLEMATTSGNHSLVPAKKEAAQLKKQNGISEDVDFARFDESSPEGKYLKLRGQKLYEEMLAQHRLKKINLERFAKELGPEEQFPESLDINLKLASYPHTQWMLGQLTSKLTRLALSDGQLQDKKVKPLSPIEKKWQKLAPLLIPMSPDVGTSTNLNPSMDNKIYSSESVFDTEREFGVKDKKAPDLVPSDQVDHRFLRFDIEEATVMSCMGSVGKLKSVLGVPLLPLMTVYDFFVKRALDQHFYNLYWQSSFILMGTPSGITLSAEGAQHGWKSDLQIPNQITWEPYYCLELDWIFCDAYKRHSYDNNQSRSGVHIRCITQGINQKGLLPFLRQQKKFKMPQDSFPLLTLEGFPLDGATEEKSLACLPDAEMLKSLRKDVLDGAYFLRDFSGYANYEPGDNVVHLFAMGSLVTEALAASQELLAAGIYANVIVVTCTDLLIGNLAHKTNYSYLRKDLGLDVSTAAKLNSPYQPQNRSAQLIPIVSVHDGEPGLLDNIGSILGVHQEVLAVRKHSRCGGLKEIFEFHQIDSQAIKKAALAVLEHMSN